MERDQFLAKAGTSLSKLTTANVEFICPLCSHTRKKNRLPCCDIRLNDNHELVLWNCKHCGESGTFFVAPRGGKPTRKANGPIHYYYGSDLRHFGKPKPIWQHRNGKGEWEDKLGPHQIINLLYRIEEVDRAIARGDVVLVVEGEKDVNTCWDLGFAATCNATGANAPNKTAKWNSRHSAQLSGANIIVLNDNDAPGYAHAEAVCDCSMQYAASVRRLDLKDYWPEIAEHQDISDWVADGHNADDLRALIPLATPYDKKAGPPPTPPTTGGPIITEQSVMRDFVAATEKDLRYNHSSGLWLTWRKHYWKPDGKQRAFCWALEYCRRLPRSATLQKVRFSRAVEDASRAQIELATENADWDQNPWLLGTPNGVVDLKNGVLRPGAPADMISKVTTVSPREDEYCPTWIEFVNFALDGDADNIEFLKRYCGYALTGLTSEERLLYIAGLSGSGKGTFMKTIGALLGDYAAFLPITMFTDQSSKMEYYRAKLAGYRLVIAGEPEKGSTWSEAFVNEVTGSDRLSGRHPGGRPFDFNPTHKLWLHGNTVPDLKGMATGMKRRLNLLPFDQVPDNPDVKLKDKLTREGDGILRWAINGCLDWQRLGLAPPPDVQAAAAEYFEIQDTFTRWVDDCCDAISTAQETPQNLRQSYNAWAGKNNEKPMSANAFHDAIKFCPLRLQAITLHGKRFVRGIVLKGNRQDDLRY